MGIGPAGIIAGGAAGGALGAQLGMVTEYGIATTIEDKDVKGDVGELSWKRAGTDALLGGVSGAVVGGAGSAIGKAAGKTVITEGAKVGILGGLRIAAGGAGNVVTQTMLECVVFLRSERSRRLNAPRV
jgi:hypothetical protein